MKPLNNIKLNSIEQKSPAFLYTNNEAEEGKIKQLTSLAIAPKCKIHRNKPKQRVKDLYSRNYRNLGK